MVIDTAVVVSSLIFSREKWSWMRPGWMWGIIRPIVCRSTVLELMRVLGYPKFSLSLEERNSLVQDYLPFTEAVDDPPKNTGLPFCRDLMDQVFLNLAFTQSADYLISGDTDLLEYPDADSLHIVSPAHFREILEIGR